MKDEILNKNKWSETDFDSMNWHDNKIYALSFNLDHELLFDIDYILKWVKNENDSYFNFWVAPATLIFKNVYNLEIISANLDMVIQDICRKNPTTPRNANFIKADFEYDWTIETISGDISFKSVGYEQYIRQSPILLSTQKIDIQTRGGISFQSYP